MVSRAGFTLFGRIYLWSVIAAGFAAVGGSIFQLYVEPIGYQWFLLATLTLISGSATVKIPSSNASISISETFVFTAVLLYGPAAGTVIVALDGLVISFWLSKRHDAPHRALFNMSAPAVSAWCSASLFFHVTGIAPLVKEASPVNAILPGLVLFALTYFALNSWLITFVIALERHLNPFKVWTNNFVWLSLNYFGGASVAFLLVGYNRTIDLGYIGVIVPLLLVLYFTFKTAMARVDDADKHVAQLNHLYLSTIETLAMAIDAKDQVTHGHIRRVQSYATGLAVALGVRDKTLMKAIETAALLHDMGKLAVPEHILNKPGKLTAAEFEKMKLHASVGADILSAIDFPYPVVPIVRHHHENWDGTGYPAGIKGTEIPVGARILSVVDCFDALTSDRPYRSRLSDHDAVQILIERRGSMYDPLIVDTFIQVHDAIAAKPGPAGPGPSGPPRHGLSEIVNVMQNSALQVRSPALEETAASADEMLSLYALTRVLAGQVSLSDAGDVIAKHLRRLIPSSLSVFYLYEQESDELEALHLLGEGTSLIRGMRMALGQGLSGWVAANRQTISNSDPILDLGDVARSHSPRLRACISTPLLYQDHLVGVLSLYSSEENAFNDDHRRIIEVVARQMAHTFARAIEFDRALRRDSLTGLPQVEQLDTLIQSSQQSYATTSYHGLLLINITDLERIKNTQGRAVGEEVLRHVVRHARAALRVTDILFRNAGDGFVAFLGATDADTADLVAARILETMAQHPLRMNGADSLAVQLTVTVMCAPGDGISVNELLAVSQQSERHVTGPTGPKVH